MKEFCCSGQNQHGDNLIFRSEHNLQIRAILRRLQNLFRIAAAEGYANENIPSFIQLPKVEETERIPFSDTEQAAIWKQYESGDIRAAAPLLMIYTGMMPGEAMKLTVDNIDLKARTITGVGTAENTYSLEWGTAKSANYQIAEALGTLAVTANTTHITITSGSNMSSEDIDKAVREAAEFEAQDKKRKENIDTRNNADSLVFQTEKAIQEVGDKLDPTEKAAVEADLSALKEAINRAPAESMTDDQVSDIKAGSEKLMASAQKLFSKVYEQAQAQQGAAGAGAGAAGNGPTDDGVVDGDFKEV